MTIWASASRRRVIRSGSAGVGAVLLFVLLVMVNYLGWKYHRRVDWTSSSLYTLSGKSLGVLRSLDRDIDAVVFVTPASPLYAPVTELLAAYEASSPRMNLRVIDPERSPIEAQQLVDRYQIASLTSVVFDSGADRRVIEEGDLVEYDYSSMQYGQAPRVTDFKGEQLFTGAILELVEERKPKILFTTGHGEAELDDASPRGLSQAENLLGRDNFELAEWSPMGQSSVPAGTDLVVVAGAQTRWSAQGLELLSGFLETGGRILVLADPVLGPGELVETGLAEWLARYDVVLGHDVVIDPVNPLPFFGEESFFANDWSAHPVTEALEQAGYPVVFSLARSVRAGAGVPGATATELVRTSAEGWGETDLDGLPEVESGEGDLDGPVSLAVAVRLATVEGLRDEETPVTPPALGAGEEGDEEIGDRTKVVPGSPSPTERAQPSGRGGRLVVFGDSDFATNGQLADVGNSTLLLNTMNWLVERENLLGIAPKRAGQVRLNLTRAELSSIYWLSLAVLPGLGIVLGVAVYFQRRG